VEEREGAYTKIYGRKKRRGKRVKREWCIDHPLNSKKGKRGRMEVRPKNPLVGEKKKK